MSAITIGGPLAIKCPTCASAPGAFCTAGRARAVRLHEARVESAPPEEVAEPGDLVTMRTGVLALLVDVREGTPVVRPWKPAAQAYAPRRLAFLTDIRRLASDDDVRAQLAREELRLEGLDKLAGHSATEVSQADVAQLPLSWSAAPTTTRGEPAKRG